LQATIGISVRDFNWTLPNDDEKAKMVLEITRRGHCEHSYFNTTGLADVYQEDSDPATSIVDLASKAGGTKIFLLYSKFPSNSRAFLETSFGLTQRRPISPFPI